MVFLKAITSVFSASGKIGISNIEQKHTFMTRAHHHRTHMRSRKKGESQGQQRQMCVPNQSEAAGAEHWTWARRGELRLQDIPGRGRIHLSRVTAGRTSLPVLWLPQGPLSGHRQLPDLTEKPMTGNNSKKKKKEEKVVLKEINPRKNGKKPCENLEGQLEHWSKKLRKQKVSWLRMPGLEDKFMQCSPQEVILRI